MEQPKIETDISDCCNGYESLDVFAQQFICKSDSRDYYAELRKELSIKSDGDN